MLYLFVAKSLYVLYFGSWVFLNFISEYIASCFSQERVSIGPSLFTTTVTDLSIVEPSVALQERM